MNREAKAGANALRETDTHTKQIEWSSSCRCSLACCKLYYRTWTEEFESSGQCQFQDWNRPWHVEGSLRIEAISHVTMQSNHQLDILMREFLKHGTDLNWMRGG